MGIKTCRSLFVLCLVWIFYWPVNKVVIGYAFFMWAITELLNSKLVYRQMRYHKAYNAAFVGLLLLTTIDRSRKSVIPKVWEYTLDISVHFLFTAITIILICAVVNSFAPKNSHSLQALVLLAAIAFNIIGLANEFYQNLFKLKHVSFWAIDKESKLDLSVNLISSLICIGCSYWFPRFFPSRKKGTD